MIRKVNHFVIKTDQSTEEANLNPNHSSLGPLFTDDGFPLQSG